MSRSGPRRFLPVLREVDRRLTIPHPERMRLLRELEFDLEEMSAQLVAEGWSAHRADRRAVEALVPDGPSLSELAWLHRPWYVRATSGVEASRLRSAERMTLAAMTGATLALGIGALSRTPILRDPSPFLWPVLTLSAVLAVVCLERLFRVRVSDADDPSRVGIARILGLAAATAGVGATGVAVGFARLAVSLEGAPQLAVTVVPEWVARDSSMMAVSILAAMAGGLVWLLLAHTIAAASNTRRVVVGRDAKQERALAELALTPDPTH